MRYKIQIIRSLGGYLIVVTDYEQTSTWQLPKVNTWHSWPEDLKVDDLQHVLEFLYRAVSETTP